MDRYILYCLCLLLLVQSCGAAKPNENGIDLQHTVERVLKIEGISKERAITIANEDALKDYKTLAVFTLIPCEQSISWRIVYDGGGPEYVIDKVSGSIVRKQKIPQGSSETANGSGKISKQEAEAIAKRDASEQYREKIDLDQIVVFVCEQGKVWRVIFDYKLKLGEGVGDVPHASFPKYVIDKQTGKILHRELN